MSLNDPPGEFFDEISSSVGSEIVVSHLGVLGFNRPER
jgi:hypothetical protein